jgi:outer membrane protein OmpA-like peptidoglycan-associated protein
VRDGPGFGGRLGYQWRDWLAFEADVGFTPTEQDSLHDPRGVDYFHGGIGLTYTPWPGHYGGPFVHAGYVRSRLDAEGAETVDQNNSTLAGGLRYWLDDRFGLRLEARDIVWVKQEVNSPLTHTLGFNLGVVMAIGATPRDTDGDGVSDRKDKCPDTPSGARVDPTGCPIDSDGDRVFDGLDQCEGTPQGATVDARGCPSDSDGDRVFDGIDQCADTPQGATVDARGCPSDADADSVLDGLDQCPDTPQGAVVDERGCPKDGDGDGVADGLDKCPDTASGLKVDAEGCPIEIIERETEMLDTGMIRLQDVNFETGKADLPPEALPQLDVVGQLLTKWPELKIEIGGHTDSRGSDRANRTLSAARVDSVLSYLTRRFPNLAPDQFTTKGYGETQPLVPNTSDLNMAKNRRVEFKVLNKDALKKEIEKQQFVPKE